MRRSRLQIWADILRAVEEARRPDGQVRPTRVQSIVNLPHDRFWRHVAELEARDLIEVDNLVVTPRGEAFLRESQRIQDFLDRFGLGEDGFGGNAPREGGDLLHRGALLAPEAKSPPSLPFQQPVPK